MATNMTRRGAFRSLGLAGAAGLLSRSALDTGDAFAATPSCTLTAEQEEGPYYLDLEKIRRDITEGKSGLYLDLRIKVVGSLTCSALADVAVDIWHAAPTGKYSGFASEGTAGLTWLRGVQVTDGDGVARFRTIYPGWYEGRATHIHVKAHVGGRAGTTYSGGTVSHTGQLFFPDTITDQVAKRSPYSARTITRQRNATDRVYTGQHGSGSVLTLTRRRSSTIANGFAARITLGINPA
jgi:protocatechuate 3,4-dioxygenase beta subunit